MNMDKISSIDKNTEKCVICFDEITMEDLYKTPCNHIFHLSCVEKQMKPECALCRSPLPKNINKNRSCTSSDLITVIEEVISIVLERITNNFNREGLNLPQEQERGNSPSSFEIYILMLLDVIDNINKGIRDLTPIIEYYSTLRLNIQYGYSDSIPNNMETRFRYNNINDTSITSTSSPNNSERQTVQCSGITKKRKQCLCRTKDSSGLCYNHR